MPYTIADPTAVAAVIDAYRQRTAAATQDDPAGFVRYAHADPDAVAAEVVDYASDELGMDINYDWDVRQTIRDDIYTAAGDWARALDVPALDVPVVAGAVMARDASEVGREAATV